MIYVAHPYSDDPVGNMAKVENILKVMTILHPENTYISPLHTFSWQANIATWEQSMGNCLDLMQRCDGVYFSKGWQGSRGCRAELEVCKKIGMRYEVEE